MWEALRRSEVGAFADLCAVYKRAGLSDTHLQTLTSKICGVGTERRTLFHWHLSHARAGGHCVKRLFTLARTRERAKQGETFQNLQ